jgi:hypothetical protein
MDRWGSMSPQATLAAKGVVWVVFGGAGVIFLLDLFSADSSSTGSLIFLPAAMLAGIAVAVVAAVDWAIRVLRQ